MKKYVIFVGVLLTAILGVQIASLLTGNNSLVRAGSNWFRIYDLDTDRFEPVEKHPPFLLYQIKNSEHTCYLMYDYERKVDTRQGFGMTSGIHCVKP